MLERQIDEAERLAVMRNDLRVREQQERVFAPNQSEPRQSSTYFQHAQADAQTPLGRFSAISSAQVVGQGANYPAGSAWCADPGAQCLEPPLGFDNPALEEPSTALPASPGEATDGPADAPSTPLGQRAGPSLSHSGDPAGSQFPRPPGTSRDVNAGSLPTFRRRV
jgi:hypothetical protein